jgi:hypothetical protein
MSFIGIAGIKIKRAGLSPGPFDFRLVHADSPLVANVLYEPRRFPVGAGIKNETPTSVAGFFIFGESGVGSRK